MRRPGQPSASTSSRASKSVSPTGYPGERRRWRRRWRWRRRRSDTFGDTSSSPVCRETAGIRERRERYLERDRDTVVRQRRGPRRRWHRRYSRWKARRSAHASRSARHARWEDRTASKPANGSSVKARSEDGIERYARSRALGVSKHTLPELGTSRHSSAESAAHETVHRRGRAARSDGTDDGNSGTLGIAGASE